MHIRLTPMRWFALLSLLAICLALGLPPDPHALHQLHATRAAYRLAVAVLLIPYVLIWYVSFYAFAKLREYSKPLKTTKDGAAFHTITLGMGMLALTLVVPTIVALILSSVAVHHPSFKAAAVIIDNYLALFPSLVAFLLLYNGSRQLIDTVRGRAHRLDLRWYAPWFLLLGVVFSHLTIENQYERHPYHLSIWLLVVSFIVPYLYGWMVGLLCTYNLHIYARTVKGLVYRQAVKQFANGLAVTILGSIAIQFIHITVAQRFSNSLGTLLLIDYGLLAIVAAGLILMALGTKKLKLLEEV